MSTKWLLQDVGITAANIDINFQTVRELGYAYANFGVLGFTKEITNLENILTDPKEKFIVRGGTKMLKLLDNVSGLLELCPYLTPEQTAYNNEYIANLRAGIFYNEKNFDQAYYNQLDLPLLNKKCELYPIKDNLSLSFTEDVFVKPSRDQKAFNAGILEAGQTVNAFIKSQQHQLIYLEEQLVVAPIQKIYGEYRFCVVEGEVVAFSRYRLKDRTNLSSEVPKEIVSTAREYAKLYAPHDIFTMDLAATPEGFKIVEYNCWNASGLYLCETHSLFTKVNDYVLSRPSPKITRKHK